MLNKTVKYICILLLMFVMSIEAEETNIEKEFIKLLVQKNEPTLAEYARFAGECGGESELKFLLHECRTKNFDVSSKSCISLSNDRCINAENVNSYVLSFIRNRFKTISKNYYITKIKSYSKDFRYRLIEVRIENNLYLLYHCMEDYPPAGNIIDIIKINGNNIENCWFP